MRYPKVSEVENKIIDGITICRNCDNPIAPSRRHYCSQNCMEEFNRNNSWYWVRKDVLRRDKFKCSICNKRFRKRELDVDHIIPVRLGINPYDKNNLRTLCKECHIAKTKLDKFGFEK